MSLKPELKIIADHLRSSCFLIADGILPSNEGRGYVLRRIMRRAMRQIHKLGSKEPLMYKLVDILITEMGKFYPELIRAQATIISTLRDEEEKFRETLDKGLKILDEAISQHQNGKLSGVIAFKLYDTFGFPLDLTQDICQEKNIEIDIVEFNQEMELQRDRARKNWVGSGEISEDKLFFSIKEQFGDTKFLYHHATQAPAKILAIYHNFQAVSAISSDDLSANSAPHNLFIILDQTPFYATSGGQKGDDGNLFLATEVITQNSSSIPLIDYQKIHNFIDISETKKYAGNLFVHFVSDFKGHFAVGNNIIAMVNNRHRQLRAQNHSATHLLHKALKQVLGNSISQKGSNVDVKQLTFDFNLNRAMTPLEIEETEELVNFYIRQNSPVNTQEMSIEEARESGAEALFGEKYDSKVRVVKMGPSLELCGGTHVSLTGNIGLFKIISENSVASGIRRITAKSGFYALQHLKLQEHKLNALLESLKVKQQFDEVKINDNEFLSSKVGFDNVSFFINENSPSIINQSYRNSINDVLHHTAKIGEQVQQNFKEQQKELDKLRQQICLHNIQNLTNQKINQINLAHYVFADIDAKQLRDTILEVRNRPDFATQQIIAFFSHKDGKIALCLSVSADLQNRYDANKLIAPMIEIIGGKGGGGKKDLAMGGGVDHHKIPASIAKLQELLQQN